MAARRILLEHDALCLDGAADARRRPRRIDCGGAIFEAQDRRFIARRENEGALLEVGASQVGIRPHGVAAITASSPRVRRCAVKPNAWTMAGRRHSASRGDTQLTSPDGTAGSRVVLRRRKALGGTVRDGIFVHPFKNPSFPTGRCVRSTRRLTMMTGKDGKVALRIGLHGLKLWFYGKPPANPSSPDVLAG
jgi:hypothetical protein